MKRFLAYLFLLITFYGWTAYPPPVIRSMWTTNALAAGATGTNLTLYGMFYGNGGGLTNIPSTGTNAFNPDQFVNAGTGTIKSGALLTNVQFYGSNLVTGMLVGGDQTATSGSTIVANRYDSTGFINSLGAEYSSAATIMLHALKSSTGGYIASFTSAAAYPSYFRLNDGFKLYTAPLQSVTAGSAVTSLAEKFAVDIDGNITLGTDTKLVREAANTLALRNGTNANSLALYNTYNSASDYSKLDLTCVGGNWALYTRQSGSGVVSPLYLGTTGNANMYVVAGGSVRWGFAFSGALYPQVDGGYDIGTSSQNVRTLYVSNIIAKGEVTANSLIVTNAIQFGITAGGSVTLGNHSTYLANTNNTIVTLPTAVGKSGRIYTIKAINPATSVTLTNATGGQTIDGALAYSLTASNKFVTVQSDNANWWIIGGN